MYIAQTYCKGVIIDLTYVRTYVRMQLYEHTYILPDISHIIRILCTYINVLYCAELLYFWRYKICVTWYIMLLDRAEGSELHMVCIHIIQLLNKRVRTLHSTGPEPVNDLQIYSRNLQQLLSYICCCHHPSNWSRAILYNHYYSHCI